MPSLRDDSGIRVPRTLACNADYRNHDTGVANRIVHLPLRHGQHPEHRLLSALSISIGMVVDDAIVVLENVTTHIERGADPKQAAVHGTNEVAISVIASTLTLIAVFFPLTLVTE